MHDILPGSGVIQYIGTQCTAQKRDVCLNANCNFWVQVAIESMFENSDTNMRRNTRRFIRHFLAFQNETESKFNGDENDL